MDEKKQILTALVKAQMEISPPEKDGTNPMFKNRYATLDAIYRAIRKPLANNGLALMHTVTEFEGRYMLLTRLYHISGEYIENTFPMFVEKQTSQGLGSARTYACRYSVSSMLALPSDEDDDGNEAEVLPNTPEEMLEILAVKLKKDKISASKLQDWVKETSAKNKCSEEKLLRSCCPAARYEHFKLAYCKFLNEAAA